MSGMLRTAAVTLALFLCLAGTARGEQAAEEGASSSGRAFPELPLRRDVPDASGSGAMAWVSLALVAAVAGTLYWARRFPKLAVRSAGVTVVPARGLTAHASLHVVEWEGEQLLLACTAHSVVVLSRRAHDSAAAEPQAQVP